MKKIILAFLFCYQAVATGQSISVVSVLDDAVEESSGLIDLDGRMITHNDSGGEAALYEIDPSTGNVVRTVLILGATNRDWEDIDRDNNFIYIGDFGNNSGTRRDLGVYKISISDYLDGDDQASAEQIAFSYQDQDDFSSAPQNTNFDAEALISLGDRLYIFTKNWVDNRTNVYRLSKVPGTQVAEKIDQVDTQGLVTGADFDPDLAKVVLSGYAASGAFIVELTGFSDDDFSGGFFAKRSLPIPFGNSFQVEGITFSDDGNVYMSSEANAFGSPTLFSLPVSALNIKELGTILNSLYPNPVSDHLRIQSPTDISRVHIYDIQGKLIREMESGLDQIPVGDLSPGMYLLKVYSEKGIFSARLLKE